MYEFINQNSFIEKVDKIKFLVIIINKELNIDDHFNNLIKNINNKIWLLMFQF